MGSFDRPVLLRGSTTLLIAAVLAACAGDPAGTSAGATPSATERPSPTSSPELDVAAEFAAAITGPDFSAVAELSGSMNVGAGEGTISGSLTSGQNAFHQVIEVALSGSSQVAEMIVVGGSTYELEGGLWYETESGGDPMSALPTDLSSLTDGGQVERDGQLLHRLVSSDPLAVDADALGFGGPAVSDFSAEFEFFASETGEPAGMTLAARWTQDANGEPVPATMTLDYAFTRIGEDVDIRAPETTWAHFTSEVFGYRMAIPSTWDFQHIPSDGTYPASDAFYAPVTTAGLPSGAQVFEYPDITEAFAPNVWFEGSRQEFERLWEMPIESSEPVTIDGLDAQLFALHGAFDDGEATYIQEAAIIRDTVAWSVTWYSPPGNEVADRKLFLQILSTFASAS